jgi:hypothetical protein
MSEMGQKLASHRFMTLVRLVPEPDMRAQSSSSLLHFRLDRRNRELAMAISTKPPGRALPTSAQNGRN